MALSLNTTGQIKGANVTFITDKTITPSVGSNVVMLASVGIHDSNTSNRQIANCQWGTTFFTSLCLSDGGASTSTRSEIWYLNAPVTGSAQWLSVNANGLVSFLSYGGLVLNGASQTAPDASVTAGGGNNLATATLTTSTTGIWTLTSLLCEPVITLPGGNWNNYENQAGASYQNAAADYDTVGDKTVSYSLSYGASWQLCMASIAPSGGAPASTPYPPLIMLGMGS